MRDLLTSYLVCGKHTFDIKPRQKSKMWNPKNSWNKSQIIKKFFFFSSFYLSKIYLLYLFLFIKRDIANEKINFDYNERLIWEKCLLLLTHYFLLSFIFLRFSIYLRKTLNWCCNIKEPFQHSKCFFWGFSLSLSLYYHRFYYVSQVIAVIHSSHLEYVNIILLSLSMAYFSIE